MSIIHKGVRRKTTDVHEDYGMAYYAQNWRFKRVGEIGRRPGIGKSNMARLSGPVRAMICGNLYFPYLVQVNDSGSVEATLSPEAKWDEPVMFLPDGEVGQASAPTINAVVAFPSSPRSYEAGVITFTPDITYDGLSGNLIYAWAQTVGPASPQPPSSTDATFVTDFDSFCIPGLYSFTLTVSTQFNGFATLPFQFDFEVQ